MHESTGMYPSVDRKKTSGYIYACTYTGLSPAGGNFSFEMPPFECLNGGALSDRMVCEEEFGRMGLPPAECFSCCEAHIYADVFKWTGGSAPYRRWICAVKQTTVPGTDPLSDLTSTVCISQVSCCSLSARRWDLSYVVEDCMITSIINCFPGSDHGGLYHHFV